MRNLWRIMSGKYIPGLLGLFLVFGVFWAQEKQKPEGKATSGNQTSAQEKQKPEEKTPPGAPAATAQIPHNFNISSEDAARKNPVRFTEISVERGKKLYLTQCAMCHGKNGDGKGEVVEELKISPPDLTKPETLKTRTDGELFAIITSGSNVMPGQEKRMTERHKWHLVNYLRTLGGKIPEKSTGKEPEEDIILVPQK